MGDGTTTVAVMAGELLREAEKLVRKKIHPQHIIQGWRLAKDVALKKLKSISFDHSESEEIFKEDLMNIAMTTLSSKLLNQDKEHFAKIAVDAVIRLKGSGKLDYIHMIKKPGGTMKDSYLEEGFILEKSITVGCPKKLENPKIMVANTPMDYDKIKIYGTKVKVESFDKVAEIEAAEKSKMKEKVEKIMTFKPDVFINRQLVYNYPEQLFADKGVMVIEHADFEGMERIAAAVGAEILSTFEKPERREEVLGGCTAIEEIMLGEDKVIKFSGCKSGSACTIVLRGSSIHLLEEAERSMHDALCVLVTLIRNKRVVYGGGNSEMQMAGACEELAKVTRGKAALAVHSFAKALIQLPVAIADNGGYDAAELVQELKVDLENGKLSSGLNMTNGTIGCMKEQKVTEVLRVKEQALLSACEAAELIVRVDDIIRCAPRKRERM